MSTTNDAYVAEGLARMLDQFDGSVDLRKLASVFLDQAQTLEDAAFPLLGERSLDNATGDRLDRIGQLVGEARAGRDDTTYRLALKGEIAVLSSRGTAEDMLVIVQLFVQMVTPDYELREYFPKGFYLRPVNEVLTDALALFTTTALKRSVSAGTTMGFVWSKRSDALTFQLSSQATAVDTSSSLGLGNDAQTTGGRLAQVL